jgi:hypothetical protein
LTRLTNSRPKSHRQGRNHIDPNDATMIADDHPSGAIDPVYRHFAHAFVCVLEGTIVMQVKGGQQVTLTRGQTFYEGLRTEPAVHRALF